MNDLTAVLSAYLKDPADNRPLSVVLADPRLREFVDLQSLAELEDDPSWDSLVIPLADGTVLEFDVRDETWVVLGRDAPSHYNL